MQSWLLAQPIHEPDPPAECRKLRGLMCHACGLFVPLGVVKYEMSDSVPMYERPSQIIPPFVRLPAQKRWKRAETPGKSGPGDGGSQIKPAIGQFEINKTEIRINPARRQWQLNTSNTETQLKSTRGGIQDERRGESDQNPPANKSRSSGQEHLKSE